MPKKDVIKLEKYKQELIKFLERSIKSIKGAKTASSVGHIVEDISDDILEVDHITLSQILKGKKPTTDADLDNLFKD